MAGDTDMRHGNHPKHPVRNAIAGATLFVLAVGLVTLAPDIWRYYRITRM